jgi:hypothetical protein
MRRIVTLSALALAFCAVASFAVPAPVCGTGSNASTCFASIDQSGKTMPDQRQRLNEAGTRTIDIISSPDFERELASFYAAYNPRTRDAEHQRYWQGFAPDAATKATRDGINGLHVETIGGLRAWFSARFSGNLAYEGSTRPDGTREFLLNRNRLDRPVADLVATYVHEAAHKAGYSHRDKQNSDQKCEPPYVMGQIAEKLADPAGWSAKLDSVNVCPFFKQLVH